MILTEDQVQLHITVLKLRRQFEDYETIAFYTGLLESTVVGILKKYLTKEERDYLSKQARLKWIKDNAGVTEKVETRPVNKESRRKSVITKKRLQSLEDYEEELKRKNVCI